jgi:hypothetical protein
VFLDASRAIAGGGAAAIAEAAAMLSVELLKPTVTFNGAALLAAGHIPADQLAFADRVVNVAV